MARNNIVSLVAGTRGTGKTDFVKGLIQSSALPKKLVVDTFDSDAWQTMLTHNHPEWINSIVPVIEYQNFSRWRSGLYRCFDSDTDSIMKEIQLHLKNTLITFEDATKYIGSRLTPDMKKFVLDSKQKNLDLIFIFHSLAQIPPDLVRVADTLTLFKTNEGIPRLEKYPFPDIPVIMKHVKDSSNRYENITIRLN